MKLYRIESYNHWFDECNSTIRLRTDSYEVLKETPCGHTIQAKFGKNRFVNKSSRKRFAYPTIAEAMVSFIARKKREHLILSSRVSHVETALQLAETALINIRNLSIDYKG